MSTAIRGTDELTGSNDPVNISQNKLHIAQYVWDVNTLSWVRQTGASGGAGTDVVVTNFPSTQQVSGTVSNPTYAKRYEQVSSTLAYLGDASEVGAEVDLDTFLGTLVDIVGNPTLLVTKAQMLSKLRDAAEQLISEMKKATVHV